MSRNNVVVCAILLVFGSVGVNAQSLNTLYSFSGPDGAGPNGGLVLGSDGNFYGTTSTGGFMAGVGGCFDAASLQNGCGTAFKITRVGVLTQLYSFCAVSATNPPYCPDGNTPYAPLVQWSDGNFYGTTFGCIYPFCTGGFPQLIWGTLYNVTASGQLTTIWYFCSLLNCADGGSPSTGLIVGTDGNLYGTAGGSAFQLTPNGTFTPISSFGSAGPSALIQAKDGNFYGTTQWGGYTGGNCAGSGCGTVFKMTPTGVVTTLYSFCTGPTCADGSAPVAGLVQGKDGNFYGTTKQGGVASNCPGSGGPSGCGTVFKITPSGVLTTLYSFCQRANCSDSAYPEGALIQATDGNLYGTTFSGPWCGTPCGTVFRITPGGTFTNIYNFCSINGCADGATPSGALFQASDGTFYGTTAQGGTGAACPVEWGCGTVYSLAVPSVTFSSTSLNFGDLPLDTTSASKSVTLTNGGPSALTITSVVAGGDYAQTNTCPVSPSTLAPKAKCTITITFTPTVPGTDSGEITITDNAPGSAHRINLSGKGLTPISLSPASLSFGTIPVGSTSAAQTVTLTNNSSTALTISFMASGNYSAVGSGISPCVSGGMLSGNAACTISATFSPTQNAAANGVVVVSYNGALSPLQVTLSGSGSGGTTAALTVSPASLSFGNTVIGGSASRTVTVKNSSNASVTITAISSSGGDYTAVPGSTKPCGGTLGAGLSCTITVTFNPSINGTIKGSVAIANSTLVNPQIYNISGTAILPVSFSPAALNFGAVPVGTTSSPQTVTATNNQSTSVTLTSIAASGDYAATGSGTIPCQDGIQLSAGQNCTFSVTLTPTVTGTIKGVATVVHNAAFSPQVVTVTGAGD